MVWFWVFVISINGVVTHYPQKSLRDCMDLQHLYVATMTDETATKYKFMGAGCFRAQAKIKPGTELDLQ